jgi:vacuolar protein-sorting-associated protein 4
LQISGASPTDPSSHVHDLWTPCGPGDYGATEKSWMEIPGDKLSEPEVNFNMMCKSLTSQKKTVNAEDLKKLSSFALDFGQDG